MDAAQGHQFAIGQAEFMDPRRRYAQALAGGDQFMVAGGGDAALVLGAQIAHASVADHAKVDRDAGVGCGSDSQAHAQHHVVVMRRNA